MIGWLVLPVIWLGCYLWEPLLQYRYILGGFCFGACSYGALSRLEKLAKVILQLNFTLYWHNILQFVYLELSSVRTCLTPVTENTHSFLLTILLNILLTPVIIIPFAYIFSRIFEKPFLRARQVKRD